MEYKWFVLNIQAFSNFILVNKPWTPVLSRKPFSWKLLLLEARYCVNLWNAKLKKTSRKASLVDWLIPRCHSTWGGGWWWAPCRPPPSSGSAFSRSASWPTSGSKRSARWCSAGGLETAVGTSYTKTHFHVALKCGSLRRRISALSFVLYLQSRCFFFGPMISSVVALHTAFARPWKYESLKSNIVGFSNPVGFQTFFEIWVRNQVVYLASQTVPGSKNPVVDRLPRRRHRAHAKPLWKATARWGLLWKKLCSLFSKEGGPPIMGPPSLRTAVLPVAGCQYLHSLALRRRTTASFNFAPAHQDLKDRPPAHLRSR